MNPNDISLESPAKSFTYEKISRQIEECNSVSELKDIARCYVKMYLKQQEVMSASFGMKPTV